MNKQKHIIVHHNDLDGRCAGAIMYRYLINSKNVDFKDIILLEKDYTQIPVDIEFDENTTIYLLDYSFTESTFEYLKQYIDGAYVVWIDHHKSSKELMENHKEYFDIRIKTGKLYAYISIEHCGAYLTWDYTGGDAKEIDISSILFKISRCL